MVYDEGPGRRVTKVKKDSGNSVLWQKTNKGWFWVSQGQKYWVGCKEGLRIELQKEGDKGILRKYIYFPVFWEERYAIQILKTGMHDCV